MRIARYAEDLLSLRRSYELLFSDTSNTRDVQEKVETREGRDIDIYVVTRDEEKFAVVFGRLDMRDVFREARAGRILGLLVEPGRRR